MNKLKRERSYLNDEQISFIKEILSDKTINYKGQVEKISSKIGKSFRGTRYLIEEKLKLKQNKTRCFEGKEKLVDSELDVIKNILKKPMLYKDHLNEISKLLNKSERSVRYLIEEKYKIKQRNKPQTSGEFTNLSDEDIEFIKETYLNKSISYDDRISIIRNKCGGSHSVISTWLNTLGLTQAAFDNEESEHLEQAKLKGFDANKKVFMISGAQNATDVNEGLLKCMEGYAEFHDAEILVVPIRYHNPGLIISQNDKKQNWWDSSVVKYLSLQRHKLNNNVTVLSDVKIQPTAQRPLNGFESLVGEGLGVLAHPRVHMKSIPTLGETPKLLMTTGVVTKPNYTDSRSGKMGEFHHSYGFTIVEIKDDETYFVRQVIAKEDGSFNDLYFNVKDGVVTRNQSVAAMIKGDIHYGNHDEKVFEQSFNNLIPKINPQELILHDVFDGYSINHHEEKNWIKNYQKAVDGTLSLKHEISSLVSWLGTIKHLNPVIVYSNHDDFLNRFILNSNPQKLVNPQNALDYIEYAKVMLEGRAPNGLIAHIVTEAYGGQIKCLGVNDSYKIKGWEVASHGHNGVNGSRGSIEQFRKLNTHIATGHTHAPARIDGAVQVGTNSLLYMGYNNGVSSWVHCDLIIHNDKKVQHIFYLGKDKEFTTFK